MGSAQIVTMGSAQSASKRALGRQVTINADTADELIRECSARRPTVASLADGTALPVLAKEHCDAFVKLLGSEDRLAPARRISIGTACTGSAADLLSFRALEAAFQAHVPGFEVAYEFNCESKTFKRKWGMALHGLCPGEDGGECCWFCDVDCLCERPAWCDQHNKACPIPLVDIFVCATSCKDFSRANPQKRKRDAAFIGESADTLHGMLAFLRSHRPPLFIFENVDAMGDNHTASGPGLPEPTHEHGSDMDVAMSHWASLGYECQRVMVNSKNFGIPASRSRILVIGFQTTANAAFDFTERSLSCVFNTMRTLLQVCNRTHSCASGVLLPSTDAAVCMELARREAGRTASGPGAGYNVGNAMERARERGVQWGSFGPSPAMMGDAWFQTLTKQQQDSVCFSLKTHPDSLLLRDVSQSLGQTRISTRSAEDSRHCACAMLPSQMLMVFAPGQPFRLLLGREALVLQGFPSQGPTLSELIGSFSENQMADLAGDMVSTPVMLAIAMAASSAVSWKMCQ